MGKKIDLTNQIFGYLIVLNQAPSQNKRIMWHCKCKCGNELNVRGEDLRSGHTTSCGCKKKEGNHSLNLIGQKYGKLSVIKKTNQRMAHCIIWECQCDCGNITYVSTNDLRTGNTKSCGCLKSAGEQKIKQLMNDHHMCFKSQFPVQINNNIYYFDFAILDDQDPELKTILYLIEYDGIQHFKTKTGGWNNLNNLQLTQERDNIKNQWCINNNIPLIRIPYTHYDNIKLEDILLYTSNFIYNKEIIK